MNIQINKRINLDKYKLITDKKIVYAKDKYLLINLDNDYFHPKCNIIDINGNIIFSELDCAYNYEYIGNDIFKICYFGNDVYYHLENGEIIELEDVKRIHLYDKFMIMCYSDYSVLKDLNLNVISKRYDSIMEFSIINSDITIVAKDNKYGIINKNGDELIEPIYDKILNTKYNYLTLKLGNKFTIIDKNCNVINNFTLNALNIKYFSYNRFLVSTRKKDYIMDENEKIIYKAKKDEKLNLSSDNSIVLSIDKNEKIRKIIDTNDLIKKVSYTYISNLYNGVRIACKDKKYGLIDSNYNEITEFKYYNINYLYDNLFLVKDEYFGYGVMDNSGYEFFINKYASIDILNDYIIAKSVSNYDIYNKDLSLKRKIDKKYDILDSKDNLILLTRLKSANSFFPKYSYLLEDFDGNVIIPETDKKIILLNDSNIILDNHLIDLKGEYLNFDLIYSINIKDDFIDETFEFNNDVDVETFKEKLKVLRKDNIKKLRKIEMDMKDNNESRNK